MPTRAQAQSLYVRAEGSYGTDGDNDGSGYTPLKLLGPAGFPANGKKRLETNYQTGRARKTPAKMGPDMSSITFATPLQGLAAAVGDGDGAPTADDWLSILLVSTLGDSTDVDGDALTAAASGSLTITDNLAPPLLAPVYESGVNDSRTQWRQLETESGTYQYTVHRDWDDTPSTSGIMYGSKQWSGALSALNSAATVSLYYLLDGTGYTLEGARAQGLRLVAPANELARLEWDFLANTKRQESKASLPTISQASIDGATPICGELFEVEWNGTTYDASSVEVDFGLNTVEVPAVTQQGGNQNIRVMTLAPVVTITPAYAVQFETDFRAGTVGNLSVKFGAGTLASSVLNTVCFHAEAAQCSGVTTQEGDGGFLRQSVSFEVVDAGAFSGSTIHPHFIFARA